VFIPEVRNMVSSKPKVLKRTFNGSSISSGPEYHVTSETTSAMALVKEIEGDSYTVTVQVGETPADRVVEAQLVAAPD
jgi:hypothetical protein